MSRIVNVMCNCSSDKNVQKNKKGYINKYEHMSKTVQWLTGNWEVAPQHSIFAAL